MSRLSKEKLREILENVAFELFGDDSIPLLASKLGLHRQSLYDWTYNGRIPISSITEKYPQVNPKYLRSGELPVLKNSDGTDKMDEANREFFLEILKTISYEATGKHSLSRLAEELEVHEATIYKWAENGKIPLSRIRILIPDINPAFLQTGRGAMRIEEQENQRESTSSSRHPTFGDALSAAIRAEGHEGPTAFANHVGIDKSQVNRYVNNVVEPRPSTISKMNELFRHHQITYSREESQYVLGEKTRTAYPSEAGVNDRDVSYAALTPEQRVDELLRLLGDAPGSDAEWDRILSILEDHLRYNQEVLMHLVSLLKRRRDSDDSENS